MKFINLLVSHHLASSMQDTDRSLLGQLNVGDAIEFERVVLGEGLLAVDDCSVALGFRLFNFF
jgi:hypothetical protein